MAQSAVSPAKQAIMKRMSLNGKVGSNVNLDIIPNNVVDESIFEKGDEIVFGTYDELKESAFDREFTSNGRKSHGYGLIVDLTNGGAKALYFSQLRKTVQPYVEENGNFIKDGEAKGFDNELSRAIKGCGTAADICHVLEGKTIICTEVETVPTARYTNGVITGIRDAMLAHWDFKQ